MGGTCQSMALCHGAGHTQALAQAHGQCLQGALKVSVCLRSCRVRWSCSLHGQGQGQGQEGQLTCQALLSRG